MACHRCKGSKVWKGLPCIICQISLLQQRNIRNNIYGKGWHHKIALAATLNTRPLTELVVQCGPAVMTHGSDNEKAVLRKDVRMVTRIPSVHLKAGTTEQRLYQELEQLVSKAAEAANLSVRVIRGGGGGVVDGIGASGLTIGAVQDRKRLRHQHMAGMSTNPEYLQAVAELIKPEYWICVDRPFTVPGAPSKAHHAMQQAGQVLAPNTSAVFSGKARPGDQFVVPWVLYRLEVDEELTNGNEFRFARQKHHYLPSQHLQHTHNSNYEPAKRDTSYTAKPVNKHGPCLHCDDINQHPGLQAFEAAFASQFVEVGETHGHRNDRILQEMMTQFRALENTP